MHVCMYVYMHVCLCENVYVQVYIMTGNDIISYDHIQCGKAGRE